MEKSFSVFSNAILLFFILDPLGNVPLLLNILKKVDKSRRTKIIVRETFIGLVILLVFLFFGDNFLSIFHLEKESITLAGGIIFFVIAIKMIFPDPSGENLFGTRDNSDPLIVPIAMPMIAGPSALATLLVLAKTHPENKILLFASLMIAWAVSTIVLLLSPLLYKLLKDKGLAALEKLIGMLLLIMSVQMFIDGIRAISNTS
ncbi:MAG: NAAT family transporter [Psychromonas sp.]|nr:NAAT family transporter [Psychromonas sp.]